MVESWLSEHRCKITRIDLAHDDFEGETISIAKAIEWEQEGLYTSQGRPPKTHLRDDRGSGDGKTFYIGQRTNGKYCRIYEKGKQQGDPTSPWCRLEIEFKSKNQRIPYKIISNRSQYLAGSYQPFNYLHKEQSSLKTKEKEKTIEVEAVIAWARETCGPTLNFLCMLHGGDIGKVLDEVIRPGIPKRLRPYFKKRFTEQGFNV